MPEVVQAYIDASYSLVRTRSLQAGLVSQYAQDISKYAGSRALQVREIFDLLPLQLEEDPHRFVFANIEDDARYDTYDRDFLWLVNRYAPTKRVWDTTSAPRYSMRPPLLGL